MCHHGWTWLPCIAPANCCVALFSSELQGKLNTLKGEFNGLVAKYGTTFKALDAGALLGTLAGCLPQQLRPGPLVERHTAVLEALVQQVCMAIVVGGLRVAVGGWVCWWGEQNEQADQIGPTWWWQKCAASMPCTACWGELSRLSPP